MASFHSLLPKSTEIAWNRVSKKNRCPICHYPDWCGISRDLTLAVCMRVAEGAIKKTRNGGYLHQLREATGRPWERVLRVPIRRQPAERFGTLAAECVAALSAAKRAELAKRLGLSLESLERLRVGWHASEKAYTFPMVDALGRVLGIRLRNPDGAKYAVTGGHEGLFIPANLAETGRILITEGPTDAAALLDLGFSAVGRPSCTGGTALLVELVKARHYAGIIIVADADAPGQRGAQALASVLALYSTGVRIITPPAGVKDARAWKQAGGNAADAERLIASAPLIRVAVKGVQHGK